jgi:hypothetical protein
MNSALIFRGGRITSVMACEMKNAQEARDVAPFFDGEWIGVNYVSACLRKGGINVTAHFRHGAFRPSLAQKTREQITLREKLHGESQEHSAAKDIIANVINQHLRKKIPLPWRLTDSQISDYHLSGDFLSEVITVKPEHTIITPHGFTFRADIALLGPAMHTSDKAAAPVLLGLIELEYKHRFELLKCLAIKSLGVPLVSLDITDREQEICEEWGHHVLAQLNNMESTNNRAYLYLPTSLCPTFLDVPIGFTCGRHEFVIFVKDEFFLKLLSDLDRLKRVLSLHDNHVKIVPFNMKGNEDVAIVRTLTAVGPLAGPEWRQYNDRRFIRVQCSVPYRRAGNAYLFHLLKAALLNRYETLTGYKYRIDANVFAKDPLWQMKDANGNIVRIAPKHLSGMAVSLT